MKHRTDYNILCNSITQKFTNFSFYEKFKSFAALNRRIVMAFAWKLLL